MQVGPVLVHSQEKRWRCVVPYEGVIVVVRDVGTDRRFVFNATVFGRAEKFTQRSVVVFGNDRDGFAPPLCFLAIHVSRLQERRYVDNEVSELLSPS